MPKLTTKNVVSTVGSISPDEAGLVKRRSLDIEDARARSKSDHDLPTRAPRSEVHARHRYRVILQPLLRRHKAMAGRTEDTIAAGVVHGTRDDLHATAFLATLRRVADRLRSMRALVSQLARRLI